jgi:hypothetical protein
VTPLAAYVLSLALADFTPGRSALSTEIVDCPPDAAAACSSDPPARWEPCYEGGWRTLKDDACRPYAGATVRGAWVRNESREAGARRLEVVSQALADAAQHYGAAWQPGPKDLARAMLSAGAWSTGLKEAIQVGRVRGPSGEVCLMDLLPSSLRVAVPWDLARLPEAELVKLVVGRDYDSQRRCFEAGALLLVRSRREAERRCHGHPLDFSTFALYATGGACVTTGTKERPDWLATPRWQSLGKFRARKQTVFPDWYAASGGAS